MPPFSIFSKEPAYLVSSSLLEDTGRPEGLINAQKKDREMKEQCAKRKILTSSESSSLQIPSQMLCHFALPILRAMTNKVREIQFIPFSFVIW